MLLKQRPLLILDVDETLIHGRLSDLGRPCDFKAERFHFYMRPHVQDFLRSVSDVYEVAFWSSATKPYLEIVLEHLLAGVACTPRFVWDRKRCLERYDEDNDEWYFLKDLKKVRRCGFDLARVLIVEDRPINVHRHFGNAVYVNPYLGDSIDDELKRLSAYLLSIADTEDFREIEKRDWSRINSASASPPL